MKSLHGQKIKDGAAAFVEPGEEVLAGIVAAARTKGVWQISGTAAVGSAQLVIVSPMGFAITDRRLLTLEITYPWGLGIGGTVKGLLSAVPIEDVARIEVRRLLIGKTIAITDHAGAWFKLEAGAGADAASLVTAFERANATRRP
jgi:hypothetical protein